MMRRSILAAVQARRAAISLTVVIASLVVAGTLMLATDEHDKSFPAYIGDQPPSLSWPPTISCPDLVAASTTCATDDVHGAAYTLMNVFTASALAPGETAFISRDKRLGMTILCTAPLNGEMGCTLWDGSEVEQPGEVGQYRASQMPGL